MSDEGFGLLGSGAGWSQPKRTTTIEEDLRAAFKAIENEPPPPPHAHMVGADIRRENGAKRICSCGQTIINDNGTLRVWFPTKGESE